jgi:hypothetical protein
MTEFFTNPWRMSIFERVTKRKGRPPRGFEEMLRTKAWYRAVEIESGAANPFQVAQRFACEDSGLWHRYEKGEVSPTTYLALAERAYPGTRKVYEDGPEGLWKVLFGQAIDCWEFATVLDGDSVEYIGQGIPFETCIKRMCRLYAEEMEQGITYELSHLVSVIALFRLHLEVSKLVLPETDGLYEIIWAVFFTSPIVGATLERYGVAGDTINCLAMLQMERVALDPRLKLALSEWQGRDDVVTHYVSSPLEVVMGLSQLRQAHAYYLDAMPSILSSFDTRSSARKCV